MSRYPDEPDYTRRNAEPRHPQQRDNREREPRERRVEPTRERRPIDDRERDRDTRMSDPMDTRMEVPRMDARMADPRMDIRPNQRANATARLDPPPDPRGLDPRSNDSEAGVLLRDPTTGEYYREVRPVPNRPPYARDERDDYPPPRPRPGPPMDTAMTMDREPSSRPQYSEYFCPGDGIEREVIQHEICKYLGQDAICRPGRNEQGRSGFWVKAYRPFTTAMEQSLREDTVKWQRERERRARQGRSQGTPVSDYPTTRSEDRAGSYADMQARQEAQRRYPGPNDMEIDDDYDPRAPPRHRDMDPRIMPNGRVPLPVTSGYPPDPGYAAQYSLSSNPPGYPPNQQPYYGTDREPRAFPGSSTPPSLNRTTQGGYVQGPYVASRTGPPVSASIPANYPDPRRDIMGAVYPPGYDSSRRHGGR